MNLKLDGRTPWSSLSVSKLERFAMIAPNRFRRTPLRRLGRYRANRVAAIERFGGLR